MRGARLLTLTLLAATAAACTLPGAAQPTPFSFPTPDLTLTVALAPSATPLPTLEATSPPAETATPIASPSPTGGQPLGTLTPGAGAQDRRPNGVPATAQLLATAPTIDGDLAEWEGNPIAIEQNVFGAGNWSGIMDVYGHFFAGWDSQALYLAVSVTDDAFVQVSSGRNMFKGDIVELQLDADLKGDFFSTRLSNDDYQIGLSPGNFGTLAPQAYRWYPIGLAGARPEISVAVVKTEAGYDLEAKIPWNTLGITAAAGDSFGFALSLSDNDLSGQAVQQSMVSIVNTRTLTNPTTWGMLILGQ